jgi:hypothetical protein
MIALGSLAIGYHVSESEACSSGRGPAEEPAPVVVAFMVEAGETYRLCARLSLLADWHFTHGAMVDAYERWEAGEWGAGFEAVMHSVALIMIDQALAMLDAYVVV